MSEGDVACISKACFDPKTASGNSTKRIVVDNLTLDQALQINGPIGEDGWREVSHLVVERNNASGTSIQLNHAVSRQDFKDLLAARLAGIQKA